MVLLQVLDEGAVRCGASGMAQARYCGLEVAAARIAPNGLDEMRADEAGASPCAVAHPIQPAPDRLQAEVADLQVQQRQVLPDAAQPLLRNGAVWRNHDGVVHVATIGGGLQRALAVVIEAAQVEIGKSLAHQVADGDANRRRSLGKVIEQPQRLRTLDDAAHQRGQDVAVDAVEILAHVDVQQPRLARRFAHGVLQPVGAGMRAQADATGKVGGDVAALEQRADHGIDRVLHDQVAERRRLDQARLAAILDPKAVAGLRLVRAVVQLAQQAVDVAAQVAGEQERGAMVALSFPGAAVGRQQRFLCGKARKQLAMAPHVTPALKIDAPVFAARLATRPAWATKGRDALPFRHQPRRWLPLCQSAIAA